jgi:hypothetical protein
MINLPEYAYVMELFANGSVNTVQEKVKGSLNLLVSAHNSTMLTTYEYRVITNYVIT